MMDVTRMGARLPQSRLNCDSHEEPVLGSQKHWHWVAEETMRMGQPWIPRFPFEKTTGQAVDLIASKSHSFAHRLTLRPHSSGFPSAPPADRHPSDLTAQRMVRQSVRILVGGRWMGPPYMCSNPL